MSALREPKVEEGNLLEGRPSRPNAGGAEDVLVAAPQHRCGQQVCVRGPDVYAPEL